MTPKFCECGCGKLAPIARKTRRRWGHVKGEPVRFIRGHHARGRIRSPEHQARLNAAVVGEKNASWKGADANSATIHEWLRSHYAKAGICDRCKKSKPTDFAFRFHPEPHTRNREDYLELCRGCHLSMDRSRRENCPDHEGAS